MRCSKCGGYVPENDLRIYNGSVMCANCFEEACQGKIGRSVDDFFNLPLEKAAGMIFNMSNLDFGNSALTCPKCGMSLKEIETEKKVGCIECINTFSGAIAKILLKDQGSTEYMGRMPAHYEPVVSDPGDIGTEGKIEESGESKDNAGEGISISDEDIEKIRTQDIGDMTDEELKKALELAVKDEDYVLAAKIRDEINSRKEIPGDEMV
ncbi:MAG: UvrB/UvrC motif-containing protein [Clostridiales bacterium]|nr:UvrB/UvrC motif-containing protein [Clostridiales bacterium]